VTFDGDPNNPLLDIKAQHNVRRPGDRDLGVIVNLHGRLLPAPSIDLASNADYAIAPSDLVSYLLIGRAGFDYGANQQAQTLGAFLAPTVSAFTADLLRQQLGFFDAFQFQLGTRETTTAATDLAISDYLYSSTIGAEKQIKNVFLSVNTGFCSVQTRTFDPRTALGARAELRLAPELSFNLSYDPPTSRGGCGAPTVSGLDSKPGQFGLSFSHTWRF
jgi:hypothetical protein